MLSIRYAEVLILYLVYFLFFLSIPFNANSNIVAYLVNSIVVIVLFLYSFSRKNILNIKINIPFLFFVFVFIWLLLFSPLRSFQFYPIAFYFKIILLSVFFYQCKLTTNDFISFVNITYLFYLLLSILVYFNVIPEIVSREKNVFDVDFASFNFKTLIGIEGSTAHIDAYSGLVFLLNLLLNKKISKYGYAFISLLALLLTTRLTPILGLALSLSGYLFIKNAKTAVGVVILSSSLIVWIIYAAGINDYIVTLAGINLPLDYTLALATHSRSLIWHEQIKVIGDNYSPLDYIFGNFNDLFNVTVFMGWYKEYNNPHNSYLYLFYRSPLLFFVAYFVMLTFLYRKFYRKAFPVIFFILIAAYMNYGIFGIYNPIYVLTLLYLLLSFNKGVKKVEISE